MSIYLTQAATIRSGRMMSGALKSIQPARWTYSARNSMEYLARVLHESLQDLVYAEKLSRWEQDRAIRRAEDKFYDARDRVYMELSRSNNLVKQDEFQPDYQKTPEQRAQQALRVLRNVMSILEGHIDWFSKMAPDNDVEKALYRLANLVHAADEERGWEDSEIGKDINTFVKYKCPHSAGPAKEVLQEKLMAIRNAMLSAAERRLG